METSRPPLPDLTPIRSVLRNVRQAMRDQRFRMEADATVILPRRASRVALHFLRDLDFIAQGVDGVLSNVAHHIFPETTAKNANGAEPGAPAPQGALPMALEATARRMKIKDVPSLLSALRPRLNAQDIESFGENEAASLLIDSQPVLQPDEMLALFAACLTVLSMRTDMKPLGAVSDPAADLSSAIRAKILATIAQGDRTALAALLSKYASHV